MKSRKEIEARIAYFQSELRTTADGLEIMLLSRSINDLEWVLGREANDPNWCYLCNRDCCCDQEAK